MSQLKNKTSLKGFQSQLEKLKGQREVLLFKLRGVEQELKENTEKQNELERRLKNATKGKLMLSEHAILRYIERVEAILPSEVPSRVLTDKLIEMVRVLGDGVYPCGDYRVKVRGNVIVTIISNRNEENTTKKSEQKKERADSRGSEGDERGVRDVSADLEEGGQEMCGDWPGVDGRSFEYILSPRTAEE